MQLPIPLEITHRDLGGGYVEAHFEIDDIAAFLAVQTGIPYATIKARIVEAHGYCLMFPNWREKLIMVMKSFDELDDQAIRATRLAIDHFITVAEIEQIKKSYLAADFGDPHWIAWDLDEHYNVVQAVLNNLRDRGELPSRDFD